MNRWTVLIAVIMFSLFIAIGCSGGGDGSPATPSADPEITSGSNNSGQLQYPNTSLLGYYDVYLDVGNQTMEVVEDRTASYTINIVPFLNKMTSPPNGISLSNIVIDDSDPANLKVSVDFRWHHPFPTITQYKVYDFMGVIISNGDSMLDYHNLRVGNYGSDTYMTNADGYTRWFNPTEFTTEQIFGWAPGGIQNLEGNAKLNPFKAYGKGLSATGSLWNWLEGSNNDGVFQPGDGRTMSLEFPMPNDGLVFGYAAVCCWEEQGSGPYTPYHRAEPIAFRVTLEDNIYYDGTDSGGNLIADIDVWAWGDQPNSVLVESTVLAAQETAAPTGAGGANWSTYSIDVTAKPINSTDGHDMWVIAETDGNYINISGVSAPSGSETLAAFYRVQLFIATEPYNFCPVIDSGVDGNATPSKVDVETYTVVAHDPDPLDTLTYSWTVTDNSTGMPTVGFDGVPGDGAGNLDINWGSIGVSVGDSFDIDCDVDDGMCATGATTLLVTIVNAAPICDLIVVTPMPHAGDGAIEFDATGTTDPDGDTLTFEWDFDGDNIYDETPDDDHTGPDDNPIHTYTADYVGDVNMRVSDGLEEDICTVQVDVSVCSEVPYPCSAGTSVGYDSDYELTSGYNTYYGDDGMLTNVSLGFTFTFAGTDNTTIGIGLNGGITFGYYYSWYPSGCPAITSYDHIWLIERDMWTNSSRPIRYGPKTVDGVDCFIIDFHNIYYYYQTGYFTGQIILMDGCQTENDPWRVQWGTMSSTGNDSSFHADGQNCCITTSIQQNTGYTYGI